jgi:hypothetical protein
MWVITLLAIEDLQERDLPAFCVKPIRSVLFRFGGIVMVFGEVCLSKRIVLAVMAIAGLSGAPFLQGQTALATITGLVTDSTGAVVAGAKVTVTDNATGERSNSQTNRAGIYEVTALKPDNYSVEAVAPGFKSMVHSNVLVQVSDRIGLDFQLQVGSTSETVNVTTEQPQLNTQNGELGEVVTSSMIETLPVISGNNGRDPFSLLFLAGNVQGNGQARAGVAFTDSGSINSSQGDTRINGGRTGSIEYVVDGVPATGGFVHNVLNTTPAIDAVSEFKVITNGFDAEYGRLSGGLVSLSTKSGTDQFHGQVFEYNQNAYLNANTWNNDGLCKSGTTYACAKANFRLNDFGVAGGGPVIIPHLYNGRAKTFWFANYEGIRSSTSGDSVLGQTITDLERTGDLTDLGLGTAAAPYANVYDPYGPVSATPQPDPFQNGQLLYERLNLAGGDGRHIPVNQIDPIMAKYIADFLPHPNKSPLPGTGTAVNYVARQPESKYSNVYAVRIDQVISDRQHFFGRFSHNYLTDVTAPFYQNVPVENASSGTILNGGFGLTLHYDFTINPTTILEMEAGGNFSPYSTGSFLPTTIDSSSFGYGSTLQSFIGPHDIVRVQTGPTTEGSEVGCNGGPSCQFSQGLGGNQNSIFNSTNFVYSGSLTKILGRHSLKFGYESRRYYDNFTTAPQSGTGGDGYNFLSLAVTQFVGDTSYPWGNYAGQENGIGEFLYGLAPWMTETASTGRALASNYYAAYAQDDFKVTPRLTLNYGLRWETETPVTERHNILTVWDPDVASAFSPAPGFTWAGALGAAGLNPGDVMTPSWVTNGFPKGAVVPVASPIYPSRKAGVYHLANFAPRLGFAFQADNKTVLRGSFATVYLPTSGNVTSYTNTPGVFYAREGNNQAAQNFGNTGIVVGGVYQPPAVSAEVPFSSSQIFSPTKDYVALNQQAAASGLGTGGVTVYKHMPYELDWSLGVQRQLPNQWLLELTYSANWSDTLLNIDNLSHFPKSLYTGGPGGPSQTLYNNPNATPIPSPTAGQVPCSGCATGSTQPLGVLEYAYPYYGPVSVQGTNTGQSNYESGNVRVQRRFANGFQLLFNYTYSKSLDDVGGSDSTFGTGTVGQANTSNGKNFQSVDSSTKSVYGLDPADEAHRISAFYNYQLPFGRGRRFLFDTSSLGLKALDAVVGGWELSGDTVYRSGRPLTFGGSQQSSVDSALLVTYTFPSLAPGYTLNQIKNLHAHDYVYRPGTGQQPNSIPYINPNAVVNAQSFTYGNLPATIGSIRNPGFWTSDLSVMKSFPFNNDGSRYFQLRFESYNVFNHAGRGAYSTNLDNLPTGPGSNSQFGYITGPANGARTVQLGGRLVF